MGDLAALLNQLAAAAGPADPVPSADGWELVLAENIAYLVDDQRRWQALAELRRRVGLAPEQILAAPEPVLADIVAGARPAERVQRLRQCAELAIAGAPWRAYPGIGAPGADRIDLFTAARAVLALDANGLRVLTRLGYAAPARSYATSYRQAQAAASAQLPASVPALQRASQLLRRHGQTICMRKNPACARCPVASQCPSAGHPPPLYLASRNAEHRTRAPPASCAVGCGVSRCPGAPAHDPRSSGRHGQPDSGPEETPGGERQGHRLMRRPG